MGKFNSCVINGQIFGLGEKFIINTCGFWIFKGEMIGCWSKRSSKKNCKFKGKIWLVSNLLGPFAAYEG